MVQVFLPQNTVGYALYVTNVKIYIYKIHNVNNVYLKTKCWDLTVVLIIIRRVHILMFLLLHVLTNALLYWVFSMIHTEQFECLD